MCDEASISETGWWVYPGGIVGGHRDHQSLGGVAAARGPSCPRGSATVELFEQPEATGVGVLELRFTFELKD